MFHAKAYLSFVFVCIVWGTSALAIRIGVLHFPALLFGGVRNVVAGLILLIAALIYKRIGKWSLRYILNQAIIGFMLITMTGGLVTWSLVEIPSGINMVLCSTMPMVAVLFNIALSKTERFNLSIICGMLLALGGVALLFKDHISDLNNSAYLLSVIALFISRISFALGSIFIKKLPQSVHTLFDSGLQLFFGGIFMLLLSPITDDYKQVPEITKEVLMSLIYLIVFGSVLGHAAYVYTLAHLPLGIATSFAYFTPLIAIVLGYYVLNEPVGVYLWLAFLIITLGVILIMKGYRRVQEKYGG